MSNLLKEECFWTVIFIYFFSII